MMTSPETASFDRWWLGIACALLVGGAIRLGGIDHQSFWYDEAYSARIAERATTWQLFTGQHRDNGNPPLYYIAHRWTARLFDNTEAGHRAFAAICGILTIPVIGLLAQRLHGDLAGWIAAWLFALSPLSVELSNEARVYSFVHFITALDALLLLNWLNSRRMTDGLAYMLVTALACYAHYFIVFFVFSHLIMLLMLQDRWTTFFKWCVLMLGVAAIWSAWIPAFLAQLGTPGNLARMEGAWIMQFASTPVVFAVGRTFAWRDAGPMLLGLAAGVSLIGFCIPAALGWWRTFQANRPQAVLLAGWALFPVVIPFLVALFASPIYHHRYGSVGLPAFLCLAAIGLATLPVSARTIPVSVIALGTVFSLTNYFTHPIKDDWRAASLKVLASADPAELILTDQDIEVLPLLYYALRTQQIPEEIYGIADFDESAGRLLAVRYDSGRKAHQEPSDHTDRIMSAQSLCLALCVPAHQLEDYEKLFGRQGFRLASVDEFYRITVARFERSEAVAGPIRPAQ